MTLSATRKQYSAEEKIRIVLDDLRGGDSIAELCRRVSASLRISPHDSITRAYEYKLEQGKPVREVGSASLHSVSF